MLKIKKLLSGIIIGIFSFSLLISTGCSRHPNTEQISKMEEARSACLAAEQKLNDVQKQREGVEQKLASKKDELNGLQKEKDLIQQRLSNWKSE